MQRLKNAFVYNSIRLFRLRSSTEQVARGFALGFIVGFFPTFGLGLLLSGFVARLLGGNLLAGFIGGSVLTFLLPLVLAWDTYVGWWFAPEVRTLNHLAGIQIEENSKLFYGQLGMLGAVLNSLVFGAIVYFAVLLLYQRVRPGALAKLRGHARQRKRSPVALEGEV
jgi:uncharacterized protein (DUF2062 family)